MSQAAGKTPLRKKAYQLEELWDDLLSSQPDRVLAAYDSLEQSEQKAILTHLQHMMTEPGWYTAQRLSARVALKAIKSKSRQGK